MPPIVPLADAEEFLGVTPASPEEAIVSGILNAISDEVRLLTRRPLETEATAYDEVLRIRRSLEFNLPEVPVDPDEVITITPVLFDGEELDPLEATTWRLEAADRGLIQLSSRHEYVRVTWKTTGAISDGLRQAVLDWLKDRFDNRDRTRDLASYATGEDAESYFASLVGKAPSSVGRQLGLHWNGQAVVI